MISSSVKPLAVFTACFLIALAAKYPLPAVADPLENFSLKGAYFGPVLSLASFRQKYTPTGGPSRQISGTGKLIGAIAGYDLSRNKMLIALESDFGFADQSNRLIAFSAAFKTRIGLHKSFGTPYLTTGYTIAGVHNPSSIAPKRLLHGVQFGAGFDRPLSRVLSGRLDFTYSRFFNSRNSSRQHSHALRAALVFHITK